MPIQKVLCKLKSQMVLETFSGEKTPRPVAGQYPIHLNSLRARKKHFLDRGAGILAQDGLEQQERRRLPELEQLWASWKWESVY